MENIEIIRKACIAANPSILDLKFGCEIEYPISEGTTKGVFMYPRHDLKRNLEMFVVKNDHTGMIDDLVYGGDFEILGRPIRLSDILLAIGGITDKRGWHVDTIGGFWHNGHYVFDGWNLRNDDLTAQTPETLSFLADLLAQK